MLERLARAVYRRLNPAARNALRTWLVLDAADRDPQLIERFDEARVLVLAPHCDDEVIGCGGTIVRHVSAGSIVHVAYMTDGRRGSGELLSASGSGAERSRRQAELVAVRNRESRLAAAVLGSQVLHFLDRPDSELRPDVDTVSMLAALLSDVRPELVYLPFVYDAHRDHWQTNRVFAAAVSRVDTDTARSLRVRGYEVWTPLPANRVADVTQVMSVKRHALAQFGSQLSDQDYLRASEGLAAYRSIGVLHGRGFAEAFHETGLAAYLRLIRAATAHGAHARPVRCAPTAAGGAD